MHWLDPDCLPETAGIVMRFLINPRGEIDGIILKGGTETHFPPHLSAKIGKAVATGDKVKIRGVRPRAANMVVGVAIETAKGIRIVDNGPPEEHKHGKHVRGAPAKGDTEPADATGIVRQALHGPKGEVRGVLLEDGAAIRFPKHEAERFKPLTKVGAKFAARGNALTSEFGTVLDAREIGSSVKTLQPVKPKQQRTGKPHHKRDHPADIH
jgi:hypothetical protein